MRLKGTLAVGATLTNGDTYRNRIYLPPGQVSTLSARVKLTVSGGTPTVQLVPQTANIRPDGLDTTVSSVTTGLTAATNLTNGAEAVHTLTVLGDEVVDVVVDVTGASAAGTVTYVDLYCKMGV